jgi:hypothetical protein
LLCSKSWKNLYQNYKPGKWYWESVIVARKVRHMSQAAVLSSCVLAALPS